MQAAHTHEHVYTMDGLDGVGVSPELVLKHTPGKYAKSHHSWWVPTACDPSEVFEVVEQPELEGEQ